MGHHRTRFVRMSALLFLTVHELRSLLLAPASYIAAVLCATLMGFLYFLALLSASAAQQFLPVSTLFFSLFWLPALLVVPLFTMRSIAEERRQGTLAALLGAPTDPLVVVLAKFFASYAFYLLVWFSALAFPFIATLTLGFDLKDSPLLAAPPILGGFLFIALSGALFIAIGIFSSAMTRSQLVAGMLSFSLIFALVVGVTALQFLPNALIAQSALPTALTDLIAIFQHWEAFSRGTIDSRVILYYLSATALFLGLSRLRIDFYR